MKSIYVVVGVILTLSSVHAEEIKVYPKGVSQAQIKKHGRARTKARIHQITRSGIFSGLTEGEKDKVRKKAMASPKHEWSTTEKVKKHKKSLKKTDKCHIGGDITPSKPLPKHKIKKSNPNTNNKVKS